MRVTTSQAQRSQLEYIQGNLQRLVKAQDEAATGKRFHKGSEDPAGAADVMRADSAIATYAQMNRNGDLALARAAEEDRVLNNLQLITERARELASQQSGSTADASILAARSLRYLAFMVSRSEPELMPILVSLLAC